MTIYDRAGTALADINLPDPDVEYDERLNSVVALEVHPACLNLYWRLAGPGNLLCLLAGGCHTVPVGF